MSLNNWNTLNTYRMMQDYLHGKDPNNPNSSGPYDTGSALGNAYQIRDFNVDQPSKIREIADLVNNINLNAQKKANEARIPGGADLEKASSASIKSEFAGELPPDVDRYLSRVGAERGTGRGLSGSPNEMSSLLQLLGLTSLDLNERAQRNLTLADQRNPGAPIYDPSKQFVDPNASFNYTLGAGALNERVFNDILNQNYRQSLLNNADTSRIASNNAFNYPSVPGSGIPTAADLFPANNTVASTRGGGSYNAPPPITYSPGNYFDYNPTSPVDWNTGYGSTPVSMYG